MHQSQVILDLGGKKIQQSALQNTQLNANRQNPQSEMNLAKSYDRFDGSSKLYKQSNDITNNHVVQTTNRNKEVDQNK